MKVYCLGSSSSGNCFIFDFGGDVKPLMVECGFPWGDIVRRSLAQGFPTPSLCGACLITHGHGDHCRGAKQADAHGIPIHGSAETLDSLGLPTENGLKPYIPKTICKGLKVMAFPVSHDCPGSMGFVIKSPRETVLFVNDGKGWNGDLRNFRPNYVFQECNHWEKQVYAVRGENTKALQAMPTGSKEFRKAKADNDLIERNLNFHMGLANCVNWLSRLDLSACRAVFLMHLSDRYGNAHEMKATVKKATGKTTYVCLKKGGIQ